MKKTLSFAVSRLLGLFALATFTLAVSYGLSGNIHPVLANPNPPVLITNLQVTPDPYDPFSQSPITLSFIAENGSGHFYNYAVLDSTGEMMAASTGRELQNGLNSWTWNPPAYLENGTYTCYRGKFLSTREIKSKPLKDSCQRS